MNETLAMLMEEYEAMYVELAPMIAQMDDLKKQIVEKVKEEGENITHGRVSATIRSGYARQSWDGKALTGYAAAHPEILAFCKESQVGPSVSIKVA